MSEKCIVNDFRGIREEINRMEREKSNRIMQAVDEGAWFEDEYSDYFLSYENDPKLIDMLKDLNLTMIELDKQYDFPVDRIAYRRGELS